MRKKIFASILLGAAGCVWLVACRASGPAAFADAADAGAELRRLWPAGVPLPEGMRFYEKARHNQRAVILNGYDHTTAIPRDRDDVFANAPTKPNPNRLFPWAVSGGMHAAEGWESRAAVALPRGKSIRYWTERIEAGASRPLPVVRWRFPDGTTFADVLLRDGKVFELRILEKTRRGWQGHVAYQASKETWPKGYAGKPDRACMECHKHAGGWLDYGSLLRGGDSIFSFPVLQEGELKPRADIPVRHWNDQ